ncbi:MAG TPA: VOC family protein, partial [Polyangia bacterium]|nr:VOC family protein [Polyangia bacterium]
GQRQPVAKETVMSNPFAYAELHTDAPAAAKAFYAQLLSWRMEDAPKSDGSPGTYTEIQPGEGFPGGLTQNRHGGPSHWIPYIKVDDLVASTSKAKSLGAQPLVELQEIPEGRLSVLADPTGARFGLWQPRS